MIESENETIFLELKIDDEGNCVCILVSARGYFVYSIITLPHSFTLTHVEESYTRSDKIFQVRIHTRKA